MFPPDMHNLAKILMASSMLAAVPARAVTEINYWLWDKDPQGTFFLPITDHGNDAVRILRATFDAIFLDGADAAPKLQAANQEIDSLFQ